MRMRRLLAVLLLLSMLVSVVPTSVFAVETENGSDGETAATAVDPSTAPSDNLFVDKTVTLTEDGTYSINMEAYATGTPITKTVELGVPLDVVLVVDQSGSLAKSGSVDSMKNSIRDFMNALKANGEAVGVDHRVSICGFASDDLNGLANSADNGYSFAGDLWDFAWLNTGLYVDGKFQDYGTMEYTRIDSLDNLDETRYYLVKYTRTLENGSSVAEYFRIYYNKGYDSWYIQDSKQGLIGLFTRKQDGDDKTTSEDLIANYEVYDIGESILQLDPTDYAASWEYIADGQGNLNADVAAAINSLASNGGTRTSYGLKMARNMLKYITPGTDNDIRKKVVVVFTDGKAGAGWNNDGEIAATLAEANKIKASGVDIYTVGVYSNTVATDIASFMNQFSSNCGLIEFSENPTTEYEYNNLDQNTWVNSVTGRYRTLPSFYKVENEDGTVEFCPVRVRVETRYTDAAKNWVVTPPYKWTYITDTGEMPIPTELLNEDGTAIKGLYKIGSGDYNSEAGYYQTSNSFDNLSSLFQTVLDKETIFYSEVELGTTAILKDVLADGFTLTDNTQITVSVVPGSVSEENSNLSPNELTSDKITWSEEAQQVLTFNYKEAKEGTGNVIVTGAADQTEMTLTATAENGEINVTGYNYAAQFIGKDHVGSKLVVTVTGVEAVTGVTTNAATSTNKATSGVYEGPESDADKDGIPGEIETPFPVPNTYLTSEYYYLDETGKVTFEIKDFLMDEGINISDGYHFFNTAEPGTTLETDYGTVTVNGDGTVTYQLKEGVELEKDIIYLFGKTKDPTVTDASANANGNMWSEITILPPLDAVGKLHTDKSATLMGDGTYTIDLEAFATGTPAITALSTGVPLDVVLVVDQSGSLYNVDNIYNAKGEVIGIEYYDDKPLAALKAAVSSFVHELQANADANGLNHRISICGFAGDEYAGWSKGRELLETYEAEGCYSYAGDVEDIFFTNTGLFVNGEFKKYGAANYSNKLDLSPYDQLTDEDLAKVLDNTLYIANKKGTQRYVQLYYRVNHSAFSVWTGSTYSSIFNEDLTQAEKDAINAEYGKGTAAAKEAQYKAEKKLNMKELLKDYDLYEWTTEVNVQLTADDYKNSWENISVNGNVNPDIAKAIDALAGNGATFISYGMRMARHMLENAPATDDDVERKKVVIVFTDGNPGGTQALGEAEEDAALAEAKKIKDGLFDKNSNAINAEIYTVGIYEGETEGDNDFMNQLSSNCKSHTFSGPVAHTLNTSANHFLATYYRMLTPDCFYQLVKANGDKEYCPIKVYWTSETGYEWYYVTDDGLKAIPAGMVSSDDPKTITGVYTLESGEYNPDLGYYSNSDNFSDLPGLFREIVTEVSTYSSEVQLDAKAILKDVMADGFTLTNNTQITVSVVPGSVKEGFADVGANRLGSEHISWSAPQEVLTFKYSEAKEGTGNVIVNGAADQTEMTLSAQVTEDGIITVTGFNYASPADNHKENAQYICAGHPGSKLVVTITGVEAKSNVVTDSFTVTNKGASGIYEASDSDLDGDGEKGEMQASFPIPTTYLTSKTYYLDYSGTITINPKDFLMTVEGVNADIDGYHYFGEPGTTVYTEYGKITVNADGTITYEMVGSDWERDDVFYLFGTTEDPTVTGATANANGNMWAKIIIVPPVDIRGKLYVDKTATLEDNGTYTIDLEAYATGTPIITSITEGIPLDVVLVIDQSGSLYKNGGKYDGVPLKMLKESVTEFVETLKANGEAYGVNHRISMCGFAGGELNGASGTTDGGFSYASDMRYNSWLNTGLFVDGEFREYAKMNYIRINDPSELDVNRYYTVKFDPAGDGQYEYVRSWYYPNHTTYRYFTGQKNWVIVDGNKEADTKELLLEKYEVYKLGKSTVQLKDDDYAASWENLASGENGQGSINPNILKSIDKLASNGATNIFYGMKMASRMLENAPNDGIQRKKVVIVFTDGEPGSNGYVKGDGDAALSEVMKIKETGVEVYAVGVYSSAAEARVNTFMNHLSSNYSGHSFTTTPTRIDMSQVKEDTTGNTRLAENIDTGRHGISPYYKKVGDDYFPVVISTKYETPGVYYASYITDRAEEGGVLLGYGAWDEIPEIVGDVYMLAEPEVNKDRVTDYYKYSGDINELSAMFQELATDATTFSSQVSLDADAILKDVMADGFVLTDNTTITVSVVPGSVSEENKDLTADELTKDKITWGDAQQVLTFAYPAETKKSGNVVVNGAADQTEMTITATASADGVITVTGYNYAAPTDNQGVNAQYISYGHPGSKLVVTITGVEATPDVITDSVTTTNDRTSGIYEGPESDIDVDGEKGEMQASFPIPTTHLTSKVYVVDYAKPMTIDPADFKMNTAQSLDVDGYNYFNPAVAGITEKYGKVAVADGKVTYKPTNTNWDGYDTFYVFGTTDDATIKSATANANGNMWSKVSVIPANNVYYEDTFVTNEEAGTAGIVYSGSWTEVTKNGDKTEDNGQGEKAEENESTEGSNQGSVHGWEDTLADDTDFSAGSAHISETSGATATFTFTGTGVDIYSRTNPTTGIVVAMLYKGTSTTDEDGYYLMAEYTLMVDNLAASGDYYQIPTLSLCQIPATDDDGNVLTDENGNTIMTDLPYGTYTVEIAVSKASDSQTGKERFTYYLDGIRVYNPIQNLEGNETVSGAYGDDELNATFVEIRDKLLDANSFSAEKDGLSAGPVFIDRITAEDGKHTDNTDTFEIGTYKVFGPENEVYLSAGQLIAFAVEYREDAHYYIGMKSLTGESAGVVLSDAKGDMETISIGHTTDLYYEVYPVWKDKNGNDLTDKQGNPIGIITIEADFMNGDFVLENDGYIVDENGELVKDENDQPIVDENAATIYKGSILALTKLKVTGPAATTFKFAMVRNSVLLSRAAEVANTDTPDVENPSEGDENTDPTDPTEPSTPDVDIDNPEPEPPEEDDYQDDLEKMYGLIKWLYKKLSRWFKP